MHLIDKIKKLCLCRVHAHGAHGVAQLLGVDGPAPVHVELVEGLLQLSDLLLAAIKALSQVSPLVLSNNNRECQA